MDQRSSSTTPVDFLDLQQALAGRYSLIRELGRGGMAVVYLAQEVRLDRPVALKVLPRNRAADPAVRERFLHEARTAARLSHPHIVPIHAVHEIEDFVFFAMAYIEGETLGERIRSRGPLPPEPAARILREVGWALAYAHAQGVVHRDVKPDNILLEAGSGRAVVSDFGIARVAAGTALMTGGELMGTAEFMSPEQAAGQPADARSDLYSLGVVGFYMLSGRLPLQGANSGATLAKHMTQAPPPLASVAPGLPVALTQALDRCLAKDPSHRFANGEELADAFTHTVRKHRDVPPSLRLFMKQNRESSASLVAVEIFSVGSLVVWGTLIAQGMTEGGLGVLLAPAAVWLTLGAAPLVVLVKMARRLLRSGYGHADLVRAMREEHEEQRQEVASEYGTARSRLDRWLKRLVVGGLSANLGALGWLAYGPWIEGIGWVLGPVLGASTTLWVCAGAASAVRHHLRSHGSGKGWLRFWDSRLGRALFKAARLKLETPAASAPYGPTELAIGVAADRLYEGLPAVQRKAFRELPDTVRRLEADAERMRAHIKELDAVIVEVDAEPSGTSEAPMPTGAGESHRRASLARELQHTRAAAEDRLRQIVAALETIRIELLRLHAGAASVESVTMDLRAARDLSDDIARMLEGRREVDRLLGLHTQGLIPVPTPT